MNNSDILINELKLASHIPKRKRTMFFKTDPGDYAAHDKFIGVSVPNIRKICKNYYHLSLKEIKHLLESEYNEVRFAALIILVRNYQKTNPSRQIYDFYLDNIEYVNNWNLVDVSAHYIIGAELLDQDKNLLFKFAEDDNLWIRRIAIVATWYFIRNNILEPTFRLAEILLEDKEDLIHKATGWMLREAGKKDEQMLRGFLEDNEQKMHRTTYRYAIERLNL